MNCYNHQERPAVAICKNCQKGICAECALPDDRGFACSEKCQQEVIAQYRMIESNKSVYGLKAGRAPVTTILFLGGGLIFVLWGLFEIYRGMITAFLLLFMGLLFVILGVVSFINMKKTGIKN